MPLHQVAPGECLSSLAARFRLPDFRALYDHPQNAELKKARKNPNILLPGDRVFVPDAPEPKEVEVATGKAHKFKVKLKFTKLRVYLKDDAGKPYGGKRFEVRIGDLLFPGETKPDGLAEVDLPANQDRCILAAWIFEPEDPNDPDEPADVEYELDIGHLDPIDSVAGIQARLENLGYSCRVDGVMGPKTLAAIARFRDVHGLEHPAEGEEPIDSKLRDKLTSLHEGE